MRGAPAPDRQVTLIEVLNHVDRNGEGTIADPKTRLAVSPTGRIYRLNYDLGP